MTRVGGVDIADIINESYAVTDAEITGHRAYILDQFG